MFCYATGGGEVAWSVATHITCPDKTVAKGEFWKRVRDELFAAECDLLLCAAGSLSAVICEAARQRGQNAVVPTSPEIVMVTFTQWSPGSGSEPLTLLLV